MNQMAIVMELNENKSCSQIICIEHRWNIIYMRWGYTLLYVMVTALDLSLKCN